MSALSDLRAFMQPGTLVQVTNRYITREDHPAFGTTVRRVTKVNSASFYMDYTDRPAGNGRWPTAWPKATQVAVVDGAFVISGGGKYLPVPAGAAFLEIRPLGETR